MDRLRDVEMMTLTEFHYKRYAREYQEIDEEYRMHKTAFLIRNAAHKKEMGEGKHKREEYVFKEFKDFFDYEKIMNSVDEELTVEKKKEPSHKLSPAQVVMQRNKERSE